MPTSGWDDQSCEVGRSSKASRRVGCKKASAFAYVLMGKDGSDKPPCFASRQTHPVMQRATWESDAKAGCSTGPVAGATKSGPDRRLSSRHESRTGYAGKTVVDCVCVYPSLATLHCGRPISQFATSQTLSFSVTELTKSSPSQSFLKVPVLRSIFESLSYQ